MKYAIKVTEHLTKVEIVEANSFNKAKEKVVNAYFNEDIILNADNSDVDVDFEDDSEFYEKEMDLQNMETTL